MDPNLFRNLGYFSVPNNQTLNPVDQSGGLGSSAPQSPPSWDESVLAAAGLGRSKDVSGFGTSTMSLDSLSPATSSMNFFSPTISPASVFGQPTRPISSPRAQRSRDGHERKRSRLNAESTPFDSVDYWLQFDEEQQQQQQQRQLQQYQQEQFIKLQQQQQQQLQQQRQQQRRQQRQQSQQQPSQPPQSQPSQQQQPQQPQQPQQQQQQPQPQQQQQQQQAQPQAQAQQAQQAQQQDDAFSSVDLSNVVSSSQGNVPTPQRSVTMTSQSLGEDQPPKLEESSDDTPLEKALSDEEESFSYASLNLADQLSRIDSIPPPDIPPREGLYSTPLSWEKPQMGLRFDSLLDMQTPTLSEAEQRRLIAIAMSPNTSLGGLGSNPNTGYSTFPPGMFGPGVGAAAFNQFASNAFMMAPPMPDFSQPQMSPPARPNRQDKGKEKETAKDREKDLERDKDGDKPKSADRTAHNDIERKYRTNLKDRISELRDAVPSLRTIPENSIDDGDDANMGGRGPKVSKGTVLTKATDYIHYLEKKNKAILQQHQELSRRLQAFEQLLNATARPTFQMPNYSRTIFDPRAFC